MEVSIHFQEQNNSGRDESKLQSCVGSTKKYVVNRLPILKWFPKYKWNDIVPDAVAGFSVGLTCIPQAMAYAGIAGLTPEYGLYSSFISCFVYIFLGSCRQMTIGPTAVIELFTFETCGQDYPSCVILTGFYVGVIQLLMGVLQLGTIVSLISEPVTIGFVSAAALTISSSQIRSFLGLDGPKGKGFLGYWKSIIQNVSSLKVGDTLMGVISVLVLFTLKNLKDWIKPSEGTRLAKILWLFSISRNALIVIVTSIIAFSWPDPPPFRLTGTVKSGFPHVGPPQFELPFNTTLPMNSTTTMDFFETWSELGTGPLSVAFVSILQNVAIAKAFGSGQSIDANQEMISLGFCHLVASFFSAMPTSGSFSRSAINEASGVRSPISGLFTGLLVIIALVFLTPSFYYIPKASLAAVILSAVLPMIEYDSFIPMWRVSKMDIFAAFVTFSCSLILGMEYGILIGVVTSIGLYLIRPLRPQIKCKILASADIPGYVNGTLVRKDCLVIEPDQGLAFPTVDYLRTYINESILLNKTVSFVALDCHNMISLDYTAATALAALAKGLLKAGKKLVFFNCNVDDWTIKFQAVGFTNPHFLNGIDQVNELITESTSSQDELNALISSSTSSEDGLNESNKQNVDPSSQDCKQAHSNT